MQFSEAATSITPAEKGTALSHILTTPALERATPCVPSPLWGSQHGRRLHVQPIPRYNTSVAICQLQFITRTAPLKAETLPPSATSKRRLLPFIRDSEITDDSNYSPYNTQACADPGGFSCHPQHVPPEALTHPEP